MIPVSTDVARTPQGGFGQNFRSEIYYPSVSVPIARPCRRHFWSDSRWMV